jgi:hypothetical protein
MMFEKQVPHDQNDQPYQEHEYGNAVDPMHVSHPLRIRRIRIPLLDIEIFSYLSPDSHD